MQFLDPLISDLRGYRIAKAASVPSARRRAGGTDHIGRQRGKFRRVAYSGSSNGLASLRILDAALSKSIGPAWFRSSPGRRARRSGAVHTSPAICCVAASRGRTPGTALALMNTRDRPRTLYRASLAHSHSEITHPAHTLAKVRTG
jgi:hypothetical protein